MCIWSATIVLPAFSLVAQSFPGHSVPSSLYLAWYSLDFLVCSFRLPIEFSIYCTTFQSCFFFRFNVNCSSNSSVPSISFSFLSCVFRSSFFCYVRFVPGSLPHRSPLLLFNLVLLTSRLDNLVFCYILLSFDVYCAIRYNTESIKNISMFSANKATSALVQRPATFTFKTLSRIILSNICDPSSEKYTSPIYLQTSLIILKRQKTYIVCCKLKPS